MGLLQNPFLYLALGCTLSACTPLRTPHLSLNKTDTAIVGGKTVTSSDLASRSVVGLLIENKNTGDQEVCSGTLLKGNLILTAAHCVTDPQNLLITVVFSNVMNGDNITTVGRRGLSTAVTAWWGAETHLESDTGDIALIKFEGSAPTGYIPVTNLVQEDDLFDNQTVIIAGFGANKITSTRIDVNTYPDLIAAIQTGQVVCQDSMKLEHCKEIKMDGAGTLRQGTSTIANRHYSSSEIEVAAKSGSTCHGDSGGPGFIIKNNQFYLWGVANRAANRKVTDCSVNSIYANVSFFREWLNLAASKLHEQSQGN
ncbi:S1 family peptidase [Bdellovibrio sp. HCB288]|uniref:S1 family peptidase n=1 Tax=Bdellovibrio sp. HCB288 TaxID=3394355 RepID=UPI0039B6BF0B